MIERECCRCNRSFPRTAQYWSRHAAAPDGLRYYCKPCDRAYQAATRKRNREKNAAVPARENRATASEAQFDIDEDLSAFHSAPTPPSAPAAPPPPSAAEQRASQRAAEREAERVRRLASPYDPLGTDNFQAAKSEAQARDYGYTQHGTNPLGRGDPSADRQKKQEFNVLMGKTADWLRDPEGFTDEEIRELALYHAHLAEDEQRYMNRRAARQVSLHLARQSLDRREWKAACKEFMQGKIEATGYAQRRHEGPPLERTLVCGLSDIHLGSDLDTRSNPEAYRAIEEARRLEYVLRNVLEYKLDHRDRTELCLLINGDIIEGQLGHDGRAGAPGAEQKMVFLKLFGPFIAHCARAFKRVRVICCPGNHGRDIARHPGRSFVDKWDGIEFNLYEQLAMMSSELKNTTFHIAPSGTAIVGLYGRNLLVTHGDTEPSIKHPDNAVTNATTLGKLSNNRTYGVELHGGFFGHYHTGRYIQKSIAQLFNPAMVPPNGFGRAVGGVDDVQGQTMWESTPDHLIGDYRMIRVGPEQDRDERLGKDLIKPFRYPRDNHGLYSGRVEVA